MAYNNGFPITYPQMYYPQQYNPQMMQQPVQQMPQVMQQPQMPQPVQQPPQQSVNLIWVQGEAGAKSHLVAPNTTVPLWDSEAQRIFLKSADAAGMPSMKILNYTIEETPNISAPVQKAVNGPTMAAKPDGEFVSKAEQKALEARLGGLKSDLEAIRAEMETFRGDLYGIAGKKPAAKKKEVGADE